MKTLRAYFSRVLAVFTSPKAQQTLNQAADMTAAALPYIEIAGNIITGITPTTLDDQALAMLKAKYPQLFDGSIKNGEQLKLFAFGAAADLLKLKFPNLSTSVARLAVQAAYTAST